MWIRRPPNRKPIMAERYMDPLTGRSKEVSVTIQQDTPQGRKKAAAELTKKLHDLNSIVVTAAVTDATLEEVCKAYLDNLRSRGRKQSTILRCESQFRQFLEIFGADTLASRMSARVIQGKLDRIEKPVAWKNESLKRIKALILFAYRRDMVPDASYLAKLEPYPEQTKRAKVKDKYLEKDELNAVLDAMQVDYWKRLARFLALSGLRVGEAIALDLDDIDMDARIIRVNKTFSLTALQTTAPKTMDSNREVFMQDQLYALCKEMRSQSLQSAVLFGIRDRAFIRQGDGQRARYDAFRKYFGDICEKVLGRRCTPHILRHTMTSLFAEQGIPLEVIQHRLGHSDSDTTREIYLHITEKRKQMEHELIKNIAII